MEIFVAVVLFLQLSTSSGTPLEDIISSPELREAPWGRTMGETTASFEKTRHDQTCSVVSTGEMTQLQFAVAEDTVIDVTIRRTELVTLGKKIETRQTDERIRRIWWFKFIFCGSPWDEVA